MVVSTRNPQALFLYYSFSGQTSGLLRKLAAGLEQQQVEVELERLQPLRPLRFPIGSVIRTLQMMLRTCFRWRVPIEPLSPVSAKSFDLIILAGPTWSYNPSGPVLSLLDRDGAGLFAGRNVLPLISCRGYWRLHWYGLKKKLQHCGARVVNRMIFTHPHREPWRTMGVFLKLAGKAPERSGLLGGHYRRYGHSREQLEEAFRFGVEIGETLRQGGSLSGLNFETDAAMP